MTTITPKVVGVLAVIKNGSVMASCYSDSIFHFCPILLHQL